jgi:predicted ATPase/DNA-binding CsgD family transcriptional regulator
LLERIGMASSQLPAQLTSFIARDRELAEIQRLLSTARLLTITGAGGCGKTRLAVQAATLLGASFADGARLVSLSAISDATLLIPTIAQALALAESPDQLLFESLKSFLRDRHLLLVLDNFEQVIAAAPLLTEILSACDQVRMLVTSREALRVRGEQEFPLAPLALFTSTLPHDQVDVGAMAQCPSIALFVERAQATQPDFRLTADNATVVADLCARLDGLPLALELAASRIKLLPPRALLARLQASSLALLTSGARDLPARQQTLRATVQWSYDLLTPQEQRTFRILSAFVGGCTLEAVAHVSGEPASEAILERMASLLNKSLALQTERDGEPRLEMLQTIRAFGLELLTRQQEHEAIQRAQAAFYTSLAEAAEPHLAGREQRAWFNQLGCEQENLRAALRWGCDQKDGNVILRLTGALWQYWFLRGQWSEGRRWLDEALALAPHAEGTLALRAKALYAAARLMLYQNDPAQARALCERSVTLYRALGDQVGLLTALLHLCRILDYQEDAEPMRARAQEALTLAEALPDGASKAQAYTELSLLASDSAHPEMVTRYLAESERIYRALDHPSGLAETLIISAVVATAQGDTARVERLYEEAARLVEEVEDHHLKMIVLSQRMISDWRKGDYAAARRQFEHLIAVEASSGKSSIFLEVLAAIVHGQGLSMWAARLFGLADTLARSGQSLGPRKRVTRQFATDVAATRAEVGARLGDNAFAEALAYGRTMSVEDILAIPNPPPIASGRPAAASPPYAHLTARELDVLRLLAQDFSNPEIAERLVISRRTVDAHLRSIYENLGVRSRDAAIRVARENGLLRNRQAE